MDKTLRETILNCFQYVPVTDGNFKPYLAKADIETLEYALAHADELRIGKGKSYAIERRLRRLKQTAAKETPHAD